MAVAPGDARARRSCAIEQSLRWRRLTHPIRTLTPARWERPRAQLLVARDHRTAALALWEMVDAVHERCYGATNV
jgi:hypothetical protein